MVSKKKTSKEETSTKYINNGEYGCVFKPAIQCKSEYKKIDNNIVSKVFKTVKSMKTEHDINTNLANLDPEGKFTIREHGECKINTSDIPKTQFDKCTNFEDKQRSREEQPQLLYDYGGYDLLTASKMYSFEDIFTGMQSVFEGLEELEKKNFSHLDIKPMNMVYNPENKKVSLIDFGLSRNSDKIYDIDNINMLNYTYYYYPPEFRAYVNHLLKEDSNITINYMLLYKDKTIMTILKFFYPLPTLIQELEKTANNTYIKNLQQSLQKLAEITQMKNKDDITNIVALVKTDNFKTDYVNRIDVFSLGISLLIILYFSCYFGEISLAEVMSRPSFYTAIINLINDMIYHNPKLRLTPKGAHDRYKKTLEILSKESNNPLPVPFSEIDSPQKIHTKFKTSLMVEKSSKSKSPLLNKKTTYSNKKSSK
jgi:serine/threonine protein kinase